MTAKRKILTLKKTTKPVEPDIEVSLVEKVNLATAWLKTFKVIKKNKPLAINVHLQAFELKPDSLSNKAIRLALHKHTRRNNKYTKNLVTGDHRYDLNDKKVSDIDDIAKASASEKLAKFKKNKGQAS